MRLSLLLMMIGQAYAGSLIAWSGAWCDGSSGDYVQVRHESKCVVVDGRHSIWVDGNCEQDYVNQYFKNFECQGTEHYIRIRPDACANTNTGGPVSSLRMQFP